MAGFYVSYEPGKRLGNIETISETIPHVNASSLCQVQKIPQYLFRSNFLRIRTIMERVPIFYTEICIENRNDIFLI